MGQSLEEMMRQLRTETLDIEKKVRALMDDETFKAEQSRPGQHAEMKANIMLSVRHLEDARMRLGKAIQHAGDGVSKYDK